MPEPLYMAVYGALTSRAERRGPDVQVQDLLPKLPLDHPAQGARGPRRQPPFEEVRGLLLVSYFVAPGSGYQMALAGGQRLRRWGEKMEMTVMNFGFAEERGAW